MLCPLPFQPSCHGSGRYSWAQTVHIQCSSPPFCQMTLRLCWVDCSGGHGAALPSSVLPGARLAALILVLTALRASGEDVCCADASSQWQSPSKAAETPPKRCTKGSATGTQQKAANQHLQHHRLPDPWSVQSSSWIPFFGEQGAAQIDAFPNPWFTLCLFPEEEELQSSLNAKDNTVEKGMPYHTPNYWRKSHFISTRQFSLPSSGRRKANPT